MSAKLKEDALEINTSTNLSFSIIVSNIIDKNNLKFKVLDNYLVSN